LIGDILSDPGARSREFGHNSVLELPVQTAVKTGTSTDHRDAWAVGFSHRYTVGVWMGNVNGRPTAEVSGSQGPALVLRAVFAELHRNAESRPLYLSRRLVGRLICGVSGELTVSSCPTTGEWFLDSRVPAKHCTIHGSRTQKAAPATTASQAPRLASPVDGLHLAEDPRIPDALERFPLRIADAEGVLRTEWLVNGELVGATGEGAVEWLWPVERGRHTAQARVWYVGGKTPRDTGVAEFLVK
jgi:penicillin-binding protein 1C